MEPGQLRQRITLRRIHLERSPQSGAERRIAQDVASLYCKAEMISNRKIRTADQQRVIDTALFTLRPRKDVDIDWQVVWQGRIWTITAIERGRWCQMTLRAEGDSRHDRV